MRVSVLGLRAFAFGFRVWVYFGAAVEKMLRFQLLELMVRRVVVDII